MHILVAVPSDGVFGPPFSGCRRRTQPGSEAASQITCVCLGCQAGSGSASAAVNGPLKRIAHYTPGVRRRRAGWGGIVAATRSATRHRAVALDAAPGCSVATDMPTRGPLDGSAGGSVPSSTRLILPVPVTRSRAVEGPVYAQGLAEAPGPPAQVAVRPGAALSGQRARLMRLRTFHGLGGAQQHR